MHNLFNINGIVVITGAVGLMGKEHARAVLESNGSVALIDINKNELSTYEDLSLKKWKGKIQSLNSFDFFANSFSSNFRDGNSFSRALMAIEICIAVGKTSLVD